MKIIKRFVAGAFGFLLFTAVACAAILGPIAVGLYFLGPVGIPIGGLSAAAIYAGVINAVMDI